MPTATTEKGPGHRVLLGVRGLVAAPPAVGRAPHVPHELDRARRWLRGPGDALDPPWPPSESFDVLMSQRPPAGISPSRSRSMTARMRASFSARCLARCMLAVEAATPASSARVLAARARPSPGARSILARPGSATTARPGRRCRRLRGAPRNQRTRGMLRLRAK